MFVVVQFPIADARRFIDAPPGYLQRPSWKTPQAGVVSEYVWGFGRVMYRTAEVDPAWSDEACYALAASSIRLPDLVQRKVTLGSGDTPAVVTCSFRRLFHDGSCVARVEVGFNVRLDVTATSGSFDAEAVVDYLLGLSSVVPETGRVTRPRQLALQGPRLAGRYRDASTPRPLLGRAALVAAGNPVVLVDNSDYRRVTLPRKLEDASAATSGRIGVGFALTRFGRAGIPTWYLGSGAWADTDMRRKLRICLLRLHAEEEVLDRIMSWVDSGSLAYAPGSDAADRLDAYINRATQLLERKLNYGLPSSALRNAYDAVTEVNRRDVTAQRRAAFDGMRLQVRRKAELFIARRDAVRPLITVEGDYVNEKIKIDAQNIEGSQIGGSNNIQAISDSFNKFASARGDEDSLLSQMKIISESVTALVAELRIQNPNAAKEVTETFQSFAEESAKEAPKTGTLRVLGQALIDAAKKVAKVAGPMATAVAAVMQIFGVPAL
jgi:hypothetical protein